MEKPIHLPRAAIQTQELSGCQALDAQLDEPLHRLFCIGEISNSVTVGSVRRQAASLRARQAAQA